VGDKWTLLIVRDLAAGPRRFVELQRVLPGISTEQLRSRLNRMVADGLLTRKRYREVPPRVDYELTDRAHELMPVLGELARWGYDWAWSSPRPNESVDIGAIFRLASGLVHTDNGIDGVVELSVVAPEGEQAESFTMTVLEGTVSIAEDPAERADARVSGGRSDWVAAFAPGHDRSRLVFSGDRELAEQLLAALAAGHEHSGAEHAGATRAA
jgi:DNA-binding HxlR family transcriptional regulator